MAGRAKDHDRARGKPFLIAPDGAGGYRLVLRETRYNSQNYPVVTTRTVAESFASANAARAYAKEEYGAVAGDFIIEKATVE